MLWMILAAVWGLSAPAVIVLYLIDERAHRRDKVRHAAMVETRKVPAPSSTPRHKPLAASGAR